MSKHWTHKVVYGDFSRDGEFIPRRYPQTFDSEEKALAAASQLALWDLQCIQAAALKDISDTETNRYRHPIAVMSRKKQADGTHIVAIFHGGEKVR